MVDRQFGGFAEDRLGRLAGEIGCARQGRQPLYAKYIVEQERIGPDRGSIVDHGSGSGDQTEIVHL